MRDSEMHFMVRKRSKESQSVNGSFHKLLFNSYSLRTEL